MCGGGGGGGVATGERAPLKPIQFLCGFFLHVLLLFLYGLGGGGVIVLYSLFH